MNQPLANTLTPTESLRWTRVGMLAALALLLAYVETFVPIPIPGVKLGLANIPVLVALARRDANGATSIALIKVLATGLLFGSPLTLVYALAGTLLSLAGMIPLSRLRTMRLWMTSVVGAMLHEAGQLVVAAAVLGTGVVWVLAPALLIAGVVTGALCGVLAMRLMAALPTPDALSAMQTHTSVPAPLPPQRRTTVAFVALALFVVVTFHLGDLRALGACALFALVACLVARVPVPSLLRALRLVAAMGVLTLALHCLLDPHAAAPEAARAALRLASVALAGVAFMRLVPTQHLGATVAWLVSPLSRLGIRTQGFVLAFAVAVELVPALSEIVRQHARDTHGHLRLATLNTELPALVGELYERVTRSAHDKPR